MLSINYKILLFALLFFSPMDCQEQEKMEVQKPVLEEIAWQFIKDIETPESFERVSLSENGFGKYLRNLPLKENGSSVYLFNGQIKPNQSAHYAIIDIDVGKRDLQQCADAVMRLRAEWLFGLGRLDDIAFNFTNGDRIGFDKYRQGYRLKIQGNKTSWYKSSEPSDSYKVFRKYMDLIFSYAGTWSLEKEMVKRDISKMEVGDVFIQGGSPGHAVIVVDKAVNPVSLESAFMLAQSYMPAQDIHILKNPNKDELTPWYHLSELNTVFRTPEWNFKLSDLRSFE